MDTNPVYSMVPTTPSSSSSIYYKLICIDQEHAKIAELQIKNSGIDNIKAVMLGRALVVKIDTQGLHQKALADINYLLSCVRVNAMAYDETLTEYDKDEVNKV
jgi:hypothetical protein